jgi:hypothetical protein
MACCATYHITVRSCTEDGPVEGAKVTVHRPPVAPEVDPVLVGADETDDTGTVTILVNEEGPYTLRAIYNEADKVVEHTAVCGVNNVEIHFGLTENICFHLSKVGGSPPPSTTFTVNDDEENVIGTCTTPTTGQLVAKCCVAIPGPGTYTLGGDAVGLTIPPSITVGEKDCGDKIVEASVPGEVEPDECERHVCVTLCGCPLVGVNVTVTIPGGSSHAGTTDSTGCATLTMSDLECESWIGATYSVDESNMTLGTRTGTISAEPHNVAGALIGAGDRFCFPSEPNHCLEIPPETLFWSGGGVSATLSSIGGFGTEFTWLSDCLPDGSGGFFKVAAQLPISVNPAECNADMPSTGGVQISFYADGGCSTFVNGLSFNVASASGSLACPVNLSMVELSNPAITGTLTE